MDRHHRGRQPAADNSRGCYENGFFRLTERFCLDGWLGAGGTGIVYRAFDRRWQRHVALKMSNHRGAYEALRLTREFRALANIRHPNVVMPYELHRCCGTRFFTMELVDGCGLANYVRFGPRRGCLADLETTAYDSQGDSGFQASYTDLGGEPLLLPDQFRRLRSTFKQLAGALHALHNAGRRHGDVKPSNVLVTRTGRVVLVDFGSASALNASEPFEASPCGTLAYMPPEQCAREPLSPASDWYSLGVMLYELLTGRLPFSGTAKEMLAAKRATVRKRANVATAAPLDLVDLCARLLDNRPSQRPNGLAVLAACKGVGSPPSHASGD